MVIYFDEAATKHSYRMKKHEEEIRKLWNELWLFKIKAASNVVFFLCQKIIKKKNYKIFFYKP